MRSSQCNYSLAILHDRSALHINIVRTANVHICAWVLYCVSLDCLCIQNHRWTIVKMNYEWRHTFSHKITKNDMNITITLGMSHKDTHIHTQTLGLTSRQWDMVVYTHRHTPHCCIPSIDSTGWLSICDSRSQPCQYMCRKGVGCCVAYL